MIISMLRAGAISLAAAGLAAAAHAQAVPYGWTVAKSAAEWVATSPDQGRGLAVKLVYKTVMPITGTLDLWFPEALQTEARRYGEIVNVAKPDVLEDPPNARLLAAAVAVKPPAGGRSSVLGYAYDTEKGRQMILIILPATLGKKNPAYNAAFERMGDFWRGGEVYGAPPPPPPVAKPAAKPPAKPAAKSTKPKPKTP